MAGVFCVAITGCTYNASPIHAGLSDAQVDERVRERFEIGMPGPEAVGVLRRTGLEFRVGPIPPRDNACEHDRGLKAYIYPPNARYAGPYANPPSDFLYLWFTLDDRLEQVGHQRSKAEALPEGADTYALRVIPLGEGATP